MARAFGPGPSDERRGPGVCRMGGLNKSQRYLVFDNQVSLLLYP